MGLVYEKWAHGIRSTGDLTVQVTGLHHEHAIVMRSM